MRAGSRLSLVQWPYRGELVHVSSTALIHSHLRTLRRCRVISASRPCSAGVPQTPLREMRTRGRAFGATRVVRSKHACRTGTWKLRHQHHRLSWAEIAYPVSAMSRTELIIRLVKVVIGLAFSAYFLWWSFEMLNRLPSQQRRRGADGQRGRELPEASR